MARRKPETISDWAGGVITSGLSSRQTNTTSPRGWNSLLSTIGVQGAVPAKRNGWNTVNASNATFASAEAIIGQYEYRTVSAGVFTRYHVYTADAGQIGVIASDPGAGGGNTAIAAGIFTGGTLPDFATAKNLCFVLNAAAMRKLRGLTLENVGIVRPAA